MYGLEAVLIFLTASVRFMFAPPAAQLLGYTFWETVAITTAGGCSGVVFFYIFSARVMEYHRQRTLRKQAKKRARGEQVDVRYFTFFNKLMVRTKRRVGVAGMAFLTPVILSIPIGSVVSAKFFKHHPAMLPALMISIFIWALGVTSMTSFLGE